MTNENKQLLLKLLNEWFNEKNLNKRNTFNGNPIGKLIRQKLSNKKVKRWRNRVRGLPFKSIESDPNKCKCGEPLRMNKNRVMVCTDIFCEL